MVTSVSQGWLPARATPLRVGDPDRDELIEGRFYDPQELARLGIRDLVPARVAELVVDPR
jgi:hypothetical protein